MPFNSTLPVNGSQVSSSELRSQFTSLKALIDGLRTDVDALTAQLVTVNAALVQRPTAPIVLDMIDEHAASSVDTVSQSAVDVSDPPAQGEVEQIRDKVNELIQGLQGGV